MTQGRNWCTSGVGAGKTYQTEMIERQRMIADFTRHFKSSDRGEYIRVKERLRTMTQTPVSGHYTMMNVPIETLRHLHWEWFGRGLKIQPWQRELTELMVAQAEGERLVIDPRRDIGRSLGRYWDALLVQLCSEWGRPMP